MISQCLTQASTAVFGRQPAVLAAAGFEGLVPVPEGGLVFVVVPMPGRVIQVVAPLLDRDLLASISESMDSRSRKLLKELVLPD